MDKNYNGNRREQIKGIDAMGWYENTVSNAVKTEGSQIVTITGRYKSKTLFCMGWYDKYISITVRKERYRYER